MELSAYLIPLRRWWWLLLTATLVASVSSFIATLDQPPVYQASTTLMIGRVIDDPNPNQGEIYLAQQLAQTYADIANREPVRNATMQALELTSLPQYLARALPQTQFIEIAVTDVNPLRAQVVANELAHQLILRSPSGTGSEDQERQQFINDQLNTLQAQIEETQDGIAKLQEQLGTLNSARQLQDTQTQIDALQAKLSTLQGNYASLLANTQQGAKNTLTVLQSADLPTQPIGSNKSMSVLLSAAIGFALAAGAAYLLEYLDDTLKTPEEITRVLGVPVIGFIAETGLGRDEQDGVYVSKHPRSPIAEAYRSLRANLEFAAVDRPLSTILIASADPESGKSSVAANLAVVIAQGDKKPILMDADLRKPSIHNFTGLPNENGLSDLFRSKAWASACLKYWQEGRITVITGGKPPPNPAELLGSRKMDEVLSTLGESADVVVIDSPPFVVSDALMLAAKVDGVLLVVRPGHTRRKTSRAMMEQLNRTEARILGVVLNRIPRRGAEYYGGYLYHSLYGSDGYYTSDDNAQAKEAAKEKGDGWRSKIGLSKYLQSINRKPLTAKYQDKNRPAVQNRDETPESTSADLEGEEQEVPDISNDED